jgi:hypothetical protein
VKRGQKKAMPKSKKGARFGKKSRDWRHNRHKGDEREEQNKKKSRAQQNCMFDERLRLDKNEENDSLLKHIFEEYVKDQLKSNYKYEKIKLDDLSAFLANFVVARFRYTSISKNEYHYRRTKNRYLMVSAFTIELINILKEKKLIEVVPGFYDRKNPEKSRKTRIKRLEPLKDILEGVKGLKKLKSKELIELKTKKDFKYDENDKIIKKEDGKYKKYKPKLIHYDENKLSHEVRKHIRTLRRNLELLNTVNDKADVRLYLKTTEMAQRLKNAYQDYGNVDKGLFKRGRCLPVSTQVKAVFTENFDQNGRLYTEGVFRHQEFSEKDRKHIRINGEPTVELDYSGLHPRLLYALEGIQYNEDPYFLPAFTNEENKVLRPFFKIVLMTMLNSEKPQKTKFGKAVGSCNCWLDPTLHQPDEKFTDENYDDLSDSDKRYFNDLKKVWKLGITKADVKDILNEFFAHHYRISKYFCTGLTGFRLYNLDGKIAVDVCMFFVKKKPPVPILPIHDSFIVQRKFKKELKGVMEEQYEKHTGGFTCKIH